MGFLDKLKPQPRWKHADPAIRLEAVRALDDQAELRAIVETDVDAKVRRAAISRLLDTEMLGAVAASDADPEAKDRAADRLLALASRPDLSGEPGKDATGDELALKAVGALTDPRRLSTIAKSEGSGAVRNAALARISDARVLGSIARHAKHADTAASALSRVVESAELLEVVLNAEHRDIAASAFERLAATTDVSQLRTIEARAQHKTVSRRARIMIQDIETAEAARHAAALDRQRRESMICDAAEQLADIADISVARTELTRLTDAWAALGASEAAACERFARAVAAAEAAIAVRRREADEALDRLRTRAEAIATRVALCERIETVDGDDTLEQLASLEEEWRSLLPLVGDGSDADRLAERFAHASKACRKRHEMGARLAETQARLDAVVQEAETLPSQTDTEAAFTRWNSLSREARTLTTLLADASRPADEFKARLRAVEQQFAALEATRDEAAEQARQEVVAMLQRLVERARRVSDAEAITLREGERLMRDISAGLETAGHAGTSEALTAAVAELRALQEKIAPRVRELRDLDDWRRFANAQRQEQLIGMAEAIVLSLRADEEANKPSDLAATAKALRELHGHWQEVAEAPRQTAQRLWDRFRTATDFIRSRCEPYFAELREQRDTGLRRKNEIVAEAETLSTSNDWVRAAARLQEMQTEWQALGRLGRETERDLSQRFRAACNVFFTRRREDLTDRKKIWTDNLAQKEALCDKAEALVNSTEWDSAASNMKRLQAEWKTIGPVRKSKSDVIWNRFRAAADRFFERYHSRHEIALASKLAERETIVVELEQLAGMASGEMPADFSNQVQQLRSSWHRSVPVPVPGMKSLVDRWQAALTQILSVRPDAFAGTDLDPAAVVHKMEKLVARVESLASDLCQPKETRLSPTEQLAARLRDALANNAMGGRATEENKWRAAADAVKDAQGAWQRLPPVNSPEAQGLAIRFREACRRLSDHARRQQHPGSQGKRPQQHEHATA
ncbi:MAG: DUF349 domain-containing protein [Vicinamibacterales bacterium]